MVASLLFSVDGTELSSVDQPSSAMTNWNCCHYRVRSAATRGGSSRSSPPAHRSNCVVAGVPPAISLKQPTRLPLQSSRDIDIMRVIHGSTATLAAITI